MIKRPKDQQPRQEIDLRGPDGNAFVLLGRARIYAKQLGYDPQEITAEMKSQSDYFHLVAVFDKYFGEFVDLIAPDDLASQINLAAAKDRVLTQAKSQSKKDTFQL